MNDMNSVFEVPKGTDYRADAEKNMWSNVKWRTLFSLIDKHGNSSVTVLSKMVGLSPGEALIALESMEILEMIKRTPEGYVQTKKQFKRTVTSQKVKADIIEDFVLSNDQVINRLVETSGHERHKTRSVIYNSNYDILTKFYEKIDKAIEEFKHESNNARESWDGVYSISMALVNMTAGEDQ